MFYGGGGDRVVLVPVGRRWCVVCCVLTFSGRWEYLSNLTELLFDMDMGVLLLERGIYSEEVRVIQAGQMG